MVVTTRALAKINLHLAVHGRRADGYHDLTTVFQAIALDDAIDVRASDGPFVLFSGFDEVPADSTNLVWRAASLIADAVGRELVGSAHRAAQAGADSGRPGRRQRGRHGHDAGAPGILGRIGAGRDAGAARVAARRRRRLLPRGGTALGTGRGDQVMPLPDLPAHHVVIVRPPLGVVTSAAYEWLADARRVAPVPPPAPFQALDDPEDWRGRLPGFRNDFEPVVARRHPEIAEAVERLAVGGGRPCTHVRQRVRRGRAVSRAAGGRRQPQAASAVVKAGVYG